MSGTSTLDPDNFPHAPDRSLGAGVLGPSDTSDSGSDVVGGPGFVPGVDDSAGADLGHLDPGSDSDSSGTGERAGAGRDTLVRDGADIDTDSIQSIGDVPLTDEDLDFLASSPPGDDKGKKQD